MDVYALTGILNSRETPPLQPEMLQKIRLSFCYCYAGTKIFVPFSRSAFSLFNVPYTQRSIPPQLVCRVFPSKLFGCFLYPKMAI